MKKQGITLALLVSAFSLTAQLNLMWANTYNGTGDYTDKVKCAAKDNSGNIYLGGYTATSGNHDFLVIKLNSSGDTLWTKTYNAIGNSEDEVNDIAVDASGNVYVTGYGDNDLTKDDYITIKYNSAGAVQWVATYNSQYSQNDVAVSLAVDGSGNVFVTGESEVNDAGTNVDYATVKYNSAGVQQWAVRHNGFGNEIDRAVKIVVDAAGNPIVTGRSNNGATDDWVTIKYNTTTNAVLWTNTLDYTENDRPADMTIDASGNIYVTGRARSSTYDIATRKIDASGTSLWTKFYLGSFDDRGVAITVDGSGNVFVAGLNGTNATDYDVVTIGYNSSGTQLWAKTYNGAGAGNDEASDITVTSTGEVVVTGITDADASNGVNYDYLVLKYTSSGNVVYSKTFNGAANSADDARAVLETSAGAVVVSGGMTVAVNNMNVATLKLDSLGNQTWLKYVDGAGDNNDVGNKILTDGSGNSYVAGYSVNSNQDKDVLLHKINSGGTSVLTKTISGTSGVSADEATGIAADASGNIYICGYVRDSDQGFNYYTAKFDASGTTLWEKKYNYLNKSDKAAALALDGSGNVFVTGKSNAVSSDSSDFEIYTIKYNSAGTQLAEVRYNSGDKQDEAIDLKVAASGNVYVSGRAPVGNDDNIVTIKYSNNLSQLWAKKYDGGKDDRNEALLIDAAENIYVCGRTENQLGVFDGLLIKYNTVGDTVWTRKYNGATNREDRFNAMCFDGSGNIWLAGKTDTDADSLNENFDILIAKYDVNGNLLWDTTWSFSATSNETANAIAYDGNGRIYVAGETNKNGSDYDFVTIQVLQTESVSAVALFDRIGKDDKAKAVTATNGSVYVTGASTGNGTQYDATTLRYDLQVGLQKLNSDIEWALYPNPASGYLQLQSLATLTATLFVQNTMGQIVQTHEIDGKHAGINISALPAGVYTAVLVSELGSSAKLFVVE